MMRRCLQQHSNLQVWAGYGADNAGRCRHRHIHRSDPSMHESWMQALVDSFLLSINRIRFSRTHVIFDLEGWKKTMTSNSASPHLYDPDASTTLVAAASMLLHALPTLCSHVIASTSVDARESFTAGMKNYCYLSLTFVLSC